MYYCWIRSRRRTASSTRLRVRGVRRPVDQLTELANVQRARVVSVTRHADGPREHMGMGAATAEAIIHECRELRKEHRMLLELFMQASRRGFAAPPQRHPPPEVTPMMMRAAAGDEPQATVIEDGEDLDLAQWSAHADAGEEVEGYTHPLYPDERIDEISEQGMHDAASDAADEDERASGSNDDHVTNSSDARAASNNVMDVQNNEASVRNNVRKYEAYVRNNVRK